MDLEARSRAFTAALGDAPLEAVAALLAYRAVCDVSGAGTLDREEFLRWLEDVRARSPGLAFAVQAAVVKRNVAFVEWALAPEVGQGVFVLSWDQDGRVTHLALHTGARTLGPAR
ncbi:MAG: nuclear transport factor 2 family protein [Halobacteriales archaeon]|nr:nuclear transport factor 2 family protein [Halobacteriales archaeon]